MSGPNRPCLPAAPARPSRAPTRSVPGPGCARIPAHLGWAPNATHTADVRRGSVPAATRCARAAVIRDEMAAASISPNTASICANARPSPVVMSMLCSTHTIAAPRACNVSSACRKSITRRASRSTFHTTTASNGTGEPIRLRHPGRCSGLLWVAETPSSMNSPTTLQPRADGVLPAGGYLALHRHRLLCRDRDSGIQDSWAFSHQATLRIKEPSTCQQSAAHAAVGARSRQCGVAGVKTRQLEPRTARFHRVRRSAA